MQRPGWMRSTGLGLGIVTAVSVIAACDSQPQDLPDGGMDGTAPFGLELLAGSLGGRGNADGTGGAAAFDLPTSVAVDGAGNVYVADTRNDTIRKITPAGVVTTLAGTAGVTGSADGTGAAARLFGPDGVAVDAAGNVYVADTGNRRVVQFSWQGGFVREFGGLTRPRAVALDHAGRLLVDDTGRVARFDTRTGAALSDTAEPIGSPRDVAGDGAGGVWVAEPGNHRIVHRPLRS